MSFFFLQTLYTVFISRWRADHLFEYGSSFSLSDSLTFIYLSVAVLGLPCCAGFSPVVMSRGHCLVAARGLLIAGLLLLWNMGSPAQAQQLWLRCSKTGRVFPGQGSNLCLLHWQADSLPVSRQGSPSDSDSEDVSPPPALGQKRSFDESYKPWELGFGLVLLSFRSGLSILMDLCVSFLPLGLGTAVSSKVGQTPLPSTWVIRDLAFLLVLRHPQRLSCSLRSCGAVASIKTRLPS